MNLLPRSKLPRCLDENSTTQHNFTSAAELYRQRYFEIIDTLTSGLENRFPSKVFEHMIDIEQFITEQSNRESIVNFYKDDLDVNRSRLHGDVFLDIAGQRKCHISLIL